MSLSYASFWSLPVAPLDQDQAVSNAIRAQDPDQPRPPSPRASQSPAALFLSSFSSPPQQQHVAKPDDEGQVVSGYTLGPIIGYGASSVIRKAYSASGGVVATKIVRRSDLVKSGNAPLARRRLQHEATVWATLSHEHILPLFSTQHTPYADYFFTLYCPAGSLFDILKRDGSPALPQDDAGMMFRQVVRGLRYLHEVALYVHRDMKLENVLVDEMGVCRIGDFGMTRRIGTPDSSDEEDDLDDSGPHNDGLPSILAATPTSTPPSSTPGGTAYGASVHRAASLAIPSASKKFSKGGPAAQHHPHGSHGHQLLHRHNTTRHRNSTNSSRPNHSLQPGSLPYAAPELLLPQTADVLSPHPAQDIWALGVMLYTLLTGRLPFSDTFEPRLQMKILNGTYEVPQGIGRGAERILQGCLERNVATRWSISMVDEVGWGVGWGAEGDAATPADEVDDFDFKPSQPPSRSRSKPPPELRIPDHHNHHHNVSHHHPLLAHVSPTALSSKSRSQSRHAHLADPVTSSPAITSSNKNSDWQTEERKSRAALDAATRRSSSRVKRSLSRGPLNLFSSTSSAGTNPGSASGSTREHAPGTSTPPTSASRSPSMRRAPSGRLDSACSSRSRSRPPSPPFHHPRHLYAVPLSATSSGSAYSSSLVSPIDVVAAPFSATHSHPSSGLAHSTIPLSTTPVPPSLVIERGRKPVRAAVHPWSGYSHSRSPSPSLELPTTPLDGDEDGVRVMSMSMCLAKSLGLGHGSSRSGSGSGSPASRDREKRKVPRAGGGIQETSIERIGEEDDASDEVGVLEDPEMFSRGRGTRRRAISIDSGAFVGG